MFINITNFETGELMPLNLYTVEYVYIKYQPKWYESPYFIVYKCVNGLIFLEGFTDEETAQAKVDEILLVIAGGGLVQKDSFADFPEKGSPGAIYIAKDTGITYYWDQNTETYIATGTSGRSGIYATEVALPSVFGQSVTINKTDLVELVAGTVPYSEGSEVMSSNSVHAVITGSTSSTVTVRVVADATIDSFQQVPTEDDLPETGQVNVLYAIKDTNIFKAWDETTQEYFEIPTVAMDEDLTVELQQGDYAAGDIIPEGTPLLSIIKKLLTKTYYPTLTNPSASLSSTGAKLLECDTTLNTTFTATLNRGSINPAYGTSGYRSGPATGYILNGGTEQATNTWSVTVSESNMGPFKAVIKYSEGDQPKDSHGENYNSPLPAGQVTSGQVKYEFVNALWANTANIATVAKLSLVSKGSGTYTFNFPAQTVANPEIFDVPSNWTVSKIEMYNNLSGKWESVFSEFTQTTTTHTNAGGATVNYKRYTDNRGYAANSRQVRITFS